MPEYDNVMKRLGRLRPADFVQWIFPQLKSTSVSFEDREFESASHRVDTLYLIRSEKEEFYLHLEFQQIYEDYLPARMNEYAARIYNEFHLPVKTVMIFLNTSPSIRNLEELCRYEVGGIVLNEFRYSKIILPELHWKDILDLNLSVLLPLIPLAKIEKGEEEKALEATVAKIKKIKESPHRGELAAILYLICGYRYPKALKQLIGEKLMKDLMESVTYREAVEKGEEKGKKESLYNVLKARFQKIPKDLKEKLNDIPNDSLDEVIEEAATLKTLKEFEISLKKILSKK